MSTVEQRPPRARAGIAFYDPPDHAPALHETDVMSMPVMDPPAEEQMMEWALSGGHDVRVLFRQEGGGMSLVWSRFAPGYPLPRHSHSADCLYYVVAGEATMGNRRVGAGAGFFVPADAPYAYTAGPEGIEILEFRGVGSFDMQITESLARWARIVDEVRDQRHRWQPATEG
ncbi:MAG: cupin domain-containing protein [Acidimicrobiales bacterium]